MSKTEFFLPIQYSMEISKSFFETRDKEAYPFSDQEVKAYTDALDKIQRCVTGYSSRAGFSGKICKLFYRIWNAVKALFCCSDWQLARKAINTHKALLEKDCAFLSADSKKFLEETFKALFPNKTFKADSPDQMLRTMIDIQSEVSKSKTLNSMGEALSVVGKRTVAAAKDATEESEKGLEAPSADKNSFVKALSAVDELETKELGDEEKSAELDKIVKDILQPDEIAMKLSKEWLGRFFGGPTSVDQPENKLEDADTPDKLSPLDLPGPTGGSGDETSHSGSESDATGSLYEPVSVT